MENKLCPKCKSNNITLYSGGMFNSYICKDCGYIGSLVLEKLPRFKDGRINYSNSNKAPVLMCFVKYKDEILILKRSDKVRVYKNKWNGVGGYLDDDKTVKEKALEEINEELGINKKDVLNIKTGEPYELNDKDVKKTWFIYFVPGGTFGRRAYSA